MAPMNYTGKTVLITGGAGYIGASVAALLEGEDVTLRRLYRGGRQPAALSGRVRMEDVIGEMQDDALWPRLLAGVDVIFHLAAQTSVYVAGENPLADFEINVVPFLRLLETCRRNQWRPHIVLASTVTLAGIAPALPVDESQPDDVVTFYDLHKQIVENQLKHYAREGRVTGTVLRLANVYGPGPRSSRSDRGILNQMVRKALKGEALTVYGEGRFVRDYVYVEDVARAFYAAGCRNDGLNGRHFIIGSGKGCTIADAAKLVSERVALKTGRAVPITHVEWPAALSPIEKRNFIANPGAFRRATGWQAQIELADGIDRTVAAFQNETGS